MNELCKVFIDKHLREEVKVQASNKDNFVHTFIENHINNNTSCSIAEDGQNMDMNKNSGSSGV